MTLKEPSRLSRRFRLSRLTTAPKPRSRSRTSASALMRAASGLGSNGALILVWRIDEVAHRCQNTRSTPVTDRRFHRRRARKRSRFIASASPARLGARVAHAIRMEFHRLVHRVRSEFIEMPGLQLTLPQAARLWGLDHDASRQVIDALVEGAFLRWTAQGTVIRAKAS